MEYLRLYARRTEDSAALFRVEESRSKKFVVRPDLQQDTCPRCGKFDEIKALQCGRYNPFDFSVKQDFFDSWDLFPIVSIRLKELLERLVGDAIRYFVMSNRREFFVALPTHEIKADPNTGSFQGISKCAACGRYLELLWGSAPAALESDFAIAVFYLENRMGLTPIWVMNKDISNALKKATPRITGLVWDPIKSVPNSIK